MKTFFTVTIGFVTCGIEWVNLKKASIGTKLLAKQVLVLSVSCKHGLSNVSDKIH